MRVGLLSTINDPLLGSIIQELLRRHVRPDAIILDAKGFSERDARLHKERTVGRLPPIPLEHFESLQMPCYVVANHSSEAAGALVCALSLDLLVNAGTPRILGAEILRSPRMGIVNVHPGLLPEFRGCTCVEWAIYLDEPVGNTVHFMNERIDGGPIVLQEPVSVGPRDTYVDVRVKVYEHGAALLARGVRKILDEGLAPQHLPPQPAGRYFHVIEPEKMQIVLEKLSRGSYASAAHCPPTRGGEDAGS